MDNFVDERDYKLLEADKYTFLVLRRIIDTECSLLLTDHERLIICFTGSPYPVWIWTADGSTREEYEFAYRIVMEKETEKITPGYFTKSHDDLWDDVFR